MSQYLTKPLPIKKAPPGIPYIIGNEAAERFSFYGMNAILTVFMTQHLVNAAGEPDYMGDEDAKTVFHLFKAAAYFFPIIGAVISDAFLGKYRTIIILSLGYTLGHACLAMMDVGPLTGSWDMKPWLFAGLILIAIGAGGIKPCVSAHVGDQFGRKNKHLLPKIFSWFYFAINVGAATSTLLTPVLLEEVGPALAFGLPGALMALATFVFWLGRNKFVHIPAAGWNDFVRETFSPEGRRALLNLAPLFLIFIPVFWALFDQTGSAWVLQAVEMDRDFLGVTWLESQIQAVNPVLILILIPTFAYGVYPLMGKFFAPTPLRRMTIGMFTAAGAFAISALIETRIQAGGAPSIGWQFLAYAVITAAEIMVSITSLEFAYTQAPPRMKSFVMGVYFLGISLGNLFTAGVNQVIQTPGGGTRLEGADYYWFFTGLMVVAAIAFAIFAIFYRGRTFIQGEGDEDEASHVVPGEPVAACPSCGYFLLQEQVECPECGTSVPSEEIAIAIRNALLMERDHFGVADVAGPDADDLLREVYHLLGRGVSEEDLADHLANAAAERTDLSGPTRDQLGDIARALRRIDVPRRPYEPRRADPDA